MNDSLSAIFEFLQQFEPAVRGHAHEPPDPVTQAKVRAFARGELPASEHEPLIRRLQADPDLVGFLTETVKGMRGQDTPKSEAVARK